MLETILVALAPSPFRELLCSSLEQSGFCLEKVDDADAAHAAASDRLDLRLAFLETTFPGEPPAQLARALRALLPALRIIAVPGLSPEGQAEPAAALRPEAVLSRPFYLPSLIDLVTRLLSNTPGNLPAWVARPGALEHLVEAPVHAVGLWRSGEWFAVAPENAAEHFSKLSQGWDGRSARLRFLRGNGPAYLTPIDSQTALGLLCQPGSTLDCARSAGAQLASLLRSETPPFPLPEETFAGQTPPPPDEPEEIADEPLEPINLSAILGIIPSPDPEPEAKFGQSILDIQIEAPDAPIAEPLDTDWVPETSLSPEELFPPTPHAPAELWNADGAPPPPTISSLTQQFLTQAEKAPKSELEAIADTQPTLIRAPSMHLAQFETSSAALSLLSYTVVLAPRLPLHEISGELAERLNTWVQQLCLAFAWRLEGITIQPEYLLWSVQVNPSIAPGSMVRIIRQRTSMHIFKTFPLAAEENPSGDFWAPGFLILSGSMPPSGQLLRDYLSQTRRQQGLPHDWVEARLPSGE